MLDLTSSPQAIGVKLLFLGTAKGGKLRQGGGEFIDSAKSLGIDPAILASVGTPVVAFIKRDAGTFTCKASSTGAGAKGKLAFVPNPTYQHQLTEAGAADESLSEYDLKSATSVNLSIDYVHSIAKAGYPNLSVALLLDFRVLGIDAGYIAGISSATARRVSPKELEDLRTMGVTGRYIRGFAAVGYRDLSVKDLMDLKAASVSPAYVGYLDRHGIHKPSIQDLVRLKLSGI
ncbi:MAG TPA: hypothetical protein VJP76_08010 [Candidatus Tumulicola sp.]|nr:hypothetical protein [Candidatus Tumulicola sp.]